MSTTCNVFFKQIEHIGQYYFVIALIVTIIIILLLSYYHLIVFFYYSTFALVDIFKSDNKILTHQMIIDIERYIKIAMIYYHNIRLQYITNFGILVSTIVGTLVGNKVGALVGTLVGRRLCLRVGLLVVVFVGDNIGTLFNHFYHQMHFYKNHKKNGVCI
ncbi:hypothetical protein RFI_09650 [Reticulomyxa filosa]|uniref:Uncharacterized protein n=1 Tax=Reticulomyxa filosa TaxID=46433 RepID=X6NNI2_RETFI|nr:hypothetical protein RFI_09650 [Reticulomyxa filosa]|eukprot:ETO27483.1 hypothetical protein RFI_09650 [Reticulomyxa filosa]